VVLTAARATLEYGAYPLAAVGGRVGSGQGGACRRPQVYAGRAAAGRPSAASAAVGSGQGSGQGGGRKPLESTSG